MKFIIPVFFLLLFISTGTISAEEGWDVYAPKYSYRTVFSANETGAIQSAGFYAGRYDYTHFKSKNLGLNYIAEVNVPFSISSSGLSLDFSDYVGMEFKLSSGMSYRTPLKDQTIWLYGSTGLVIDWLTMFQKDTDLASNAAVELNLGVYTELGVKFDFSSSWGFVAGGKLDFYFLHLGDTFIDVNAKAGSQYLALDVSPFIGITYSF